MCVCVCACAYQDHWSSVRCGIWDQHAEAGHMTPSYDSEMTVGVLLPVWLAPDWPGGAALCPAVPSLRSSLLLSTH